MPDLLLMSELFACYHLAPEEPMKKLALKLADLQVETFTTAAQTGGRGTVQGHYGTTHTQAGETCEATCAEGYTCAYWYTCENTGCNYTCNVCTTMNTDAGPRGECQWCP